MVGREEEQEEQEQSRRSMDVSLLREQYRCSREEQRHVLLRTGERTRDTSPRQRRCWRANCSLQVQLTDIPVGVSK